MILRWTLALAVALLASQAWAQQQQRQRATRTAPRGTLKTVREQASYSFGMMIGTNLKKQGVDVDYDLFVQGLRDAAGGGKLLLTQEQAGAAIAAFEKTMATKKAAESQKFLADNKKRPGVNTTASGLQYKVVKNGSGPRPTKNDAVTVIYRGMFISGDEFDSSGGKPFTIGVSDVIPGWQEALQLMPVGSKWMLFIPAKLAYGERGQPPIGPNSTLVFDLELVDIAKAPPAGAAKTRPRAERVR